MKTPNKKKHVKDPSLVQTPIRDPNRTSQTKAGDIKWRTQIVIFESHQVPTGYLPRDHAAHALWTYYRDAHLAYRTVGKSIDDQRILEGDPWHNTHYEQQARTIAMWYGVTIDEMTKYWPAVRLEIMRCGLPEARWEYVGFGKETKIAQELYKVQKDDDKKSLILSKKQEEDFTGFLDSIKDAKEVDDGNGQSNESGKDVRKTADNSVLESGKDSLCAGSSKSGIQRNSS